ncbi:MAG: hypothetical protein A4E44_01215 [Methanosaeta sp. PtaB.Bin018]|nr:MAG: hypothetical protein A4E44_01215 [Methanosaeta sp. PtaB.Bin018]OPY45514.1 MAG: hypothetical protein A4E46_01231 [Methanosaeta sp. PtaU1.Bin016]
MLCAEKFTVKCPKGEMSRVPCAAESNILYGQKVKVCTLIRRSYKS